ncbi:class I SAM-dependent methyltransferase [Cohnella sp.]|uniref:class I SAM-dependent methyltransferase n=1 Tax=Cohnella sp. TaxID=1883426 RepID=UPI003567FD30
MNHFYDEAAWEKEWKDYGDSVANRLARAGVDLSRSFDSKAKSFNEQSFNEEGRRRTARIMNWLEVQGVEFEGASVLDIGAASGVFSLPFAERGAYITAVESSPPLVELLSANLAGFGPDRVNIVAEPFENVDVEARGWNGKFDLVFVSMCPVIRDWESVEKVLGCASRFCYISLPVGSAEHSLASEIWPLIVGQPFKPEPTAMGYLLHLLYLKGYSYQSIVTRETKTAEMSREAALQEAMNLLSGRGLSADEGTRRTIQDYLERAYPSGTVPVSQGGRFGKVLIRLQDLSMYG